MTEEIQKRIEAIKAGKVPAGYEKKKFGIFPDDWVTDKTLGDIGVFGKGKGIPGNMLGAGNVPCVGYGDIYMKYNHFHFEDAQSFVDEETAKESTPIQKGTLLFTGTGETAEEIGKCVCYNGDETVYAGGDIITFNSKNVNPLFLAYQQYQDFSLKRKARLGQGHSVVHIQKSNLENLPVAYPDSDTEQQKITETLLKWDKAIELQEQLIKKLELQKKALIKKLLAPKMNWSRAKFGSVVQKQKAALVLASVDGMTPIIDMDYLVNGHFCNYTNDEGVRASFDDVLLLWDGSGAGTPIYKAEGIVGSTFAKLSPNSDIVPGYLYYYLLSIQEKNKLLREGSGVPHIPKDFMKQQTISFPSKIIQQQLVSILENFDSQLTCQIRKANILKQQQKAMQRLLLTGIVRV